MSTAEIDPGTVAAPHAVRASGQQEARVQSTVAGVLLEASDCGGPRFGFGTQIGPGTVLHEDAGRGESGSHDRGADAGHADVG